MQLILESDTSLIDIKSNMSVLDQDIVQNKDIGVIEKLSAESSNDITEKQSDLKEQNNIDCKLSTTKDKVLLNNVDKEQEKEELGNRIDNPQQENYETENTQNEEVQLAISNKENSEKNETDSDQIRSNETAIISNIVSKNNIILPEMHNDTNEYETNKTQIETNDGNCLEGNNDIDIEKDCSNNEAKMDISLEPDNTAILDYTLKQKDCSNKEAKMDISLEPDNTEIVDDTFKQKDCSNKEAKMDISLEPDNTAIVDDTLKQKDCSNKDAKKDISLEPYDTVIVDDMLKVAENNIVINKPIDTNGDTKDSGKPTLDKNNIISQQKDLDKIETQIGEQNAIDHSIIESPKIDEQNSITHSIIESSKIGEQNSTNHSIIELSKIGEQNSTNHSIIESSTSEIHTVNKEQSENVDNIVQDTDKKIVDQSVCPTESNDGDKEIMEVDLDENLDANPSVINRIKTSNQDEINMETKGSNKDVTDKSSKASEEDIMDIDDDTAVIGNKELGDLEKNASPKTEVTKEIAAESKQIPGLIKLSNTLDILSDDEEESMKPNDIQTTATDTTVKPCINIEDDDDIMLIEDDDETDSKDSKTEEVKNTEIEVETPKVQAVKNRDSSPESNIDSLTSVEVTGNQDSQKREKELSGSQKDDKTSSLSNTTAEQEMAEKITEEDKDKTTPLLPNNFLSTCKKNLAEMTREELEDFCILKIVESVVNKSGLSEIKSKLKTMGQNMEEYKKKAMMLTKQNRDLQVVLKSVQEEQKKSKDTVIAPLKITRSVGMQIVMAEPNARRRSGTNAVPQNAGNTVIKPAKNTSNQTAKSSLQKTPTNTQQQIPVPRLVPAATSNPKSSAAAQVAGTNATKVSNVSLNGLKNSASPKAAEKRPHNKSQSDTVDLTDDEPPSKVPANRGVYVPPVRLVSTQNLLAPVRPQLNQPTTNSSRKVFIPIGAQGPNFRQQQFTLRSFVNQGPKPRGPSQVVRASPNAIRMTRIGSRHPAPLPEVVKQYQPPNWKALPPAPDLKLSKVENGIVISWKIDGYHEDSYEEIASYQLYAYQETSAVPSTSLWKKIGDVKALPLPMACTLTQFMSGYKYFFAVRAVDIRSRLGPFSLPGSILLLSKS